uniref:Si:ch211-14a17.10 n=1 Tax=Sinocyclocheilus anshuiensis TaxID=1608454 RepID=A0A671KY42_9TELE
VIDLQELDAIISTERDATKIERLDKRRKDAERDLAGMKTEFSGSEEIFERAGRDTPLCMEILFVLFLVLQIVILQIKAMELKTRISGKFKTQAQMDVIISKLEYKNGLLSDLKEEREVRRENREKIDILIAALEKEILELNGKLSALKQIFVQLDEQTNEFDGKRIEIMDKIAKFKGKDEIISRILKLQFEFMEALITGQGQMKADEFKINDLQKELGKEQDRALYLDADNKKVHFTIIIILLGFEIDQIMKQIKASSSNDDLKRIRDEKLKELMLKKEELKKSDASSEKILKVISQMEEIWKIQSEDPDNLNQISNLQKDLLNLISKLDDKMASKPMLKIIALQSDVTWIREMLKTVTTQAEIQKAELQKALDDVKRLLNEKNKELAAATGDVKKDIAALKKEVLTLQIQKDTTERNAMQKIKGIAHSFSSIDFHVTKINNLLDEVRTLKQQFHSIHPSISLKRSLTMKEEENAKIRAENEKLRKDCVDTAECPELQKKYNEMQAEYNNTISKLNNDILKKALKIMSIKESMSKLKQAQAQIQEKYAKEINGLKNQIENKEKEILLLQANCELSDKIQNLEKELEESKQNVKKLQQESNDKIASLQKQLKSKDQQLANTEDQLQKTNAENAALSKKSLKEKLQKQERALTEKDWYLREKNEVISALKKQQDNMKGELEKVKNKNKVFSSLLSDLEKTLEAKKQELAKKDQKLQEKDKEVATLQKENADTKAELKEERKKINGVINENEKLRQNLDETKKKVEELKEWPRFDANTAHRRLILSQDEKEARTSLFPQPVPDSLERYDTAIAVLGKNGFDSGKHYWEIGVIGRNCYVVGAARASAQRKGILRYGPSAGYWVIQKNRGSKLFANADRLVHLQAEEPSVIGVQLDFKNNKVTFYNAEKKLEIFSFTGNELQGEIHPFVETCSDTNLNEPPLILKKTQSTDWLKQ